MNRFVVDASVAAKWVVAEEHSAAALRFLQANHTLIAPDLFFAEIASVFQKKCRRGEMQLGDAETALRHILSIPIETHAAQTLVEDAVRLCAACGCTVYDGIYLALATRQGCPLITADERLANQARAAHLTVEILLLQQVQD